MTKITVLGAGAMGSRMARNFLNAGYAVTVYNRSPQRAASLQAAGATLAPTPRAAADDADVVISMVRDDEASQALWLSAGTGAIHSLGSGAVAIESSTLTPGWVTELAGKIRETGTAFLEAPVLGTRPQAEAGHLIYLVGGEAADLARVEAVLKATSRAIHHLGAIGSAAAMKLAVNTLYGVQVAIWAEMLALLDRQGIAPSHAVELLNTLPTTSPALQGAGTLMAQRNYTPLFPIDLVEKDFGYALATARALGVATPTLAAVHAIYADAKARGYGDDNIVGVKQVFDGAGAGHSRIRRENVLVPPTDEEG
ncbi:MAG: NAD(P)-dependent oxidoreductase [Chloroflexales bacterium]|nr:NAD(P)-dependent oxidoreductase [Chloroflexales bacterium]